MRRALVVLLAICALQPASVAIAAGPVTHDVARIRIRTDGSADVDRTIDYQAFLAERGAVDPTAIERRARERLTAYGAENISLGLDTYPNRVHLRLHYRLPGEAAQRTDDYLVQHVLRDPLPVTPELVANYPLDIKAVRIARITMPGTVLSFTSYHSQRLAPSSSVVTTVRLENGKTAIVQSSEVIRPGDLVDPAAIERAGLATLTFAPNYHPSSWHWRALAGLAIAIVLLIKFAIPVTRLELITEPFPNPTFNLVIAGVVAVCGGVLVVFAIVLHALPGPAAHAVQQALAIDWPQSSGEEVSPSDLSATILVVAAVLLVAAWGLFARKTVARVFILALALVLAAVVFRILVTWLPLPDYLPLQLPVLFFAGVAILLALALVVRQLGSEGMRRHYAGDGA